MTQREASSFERDLESHVADRMPSVQWTQFEPKLRSKEVCKITADAVTRNAPIYTLDQETLITPHTNIVLLSDTAVALDPERHACSEDAIGVERKGEYFRIDIRVRVPLRSIDFALDGLPKEFYATLSGGQYRHCFRGKPGRKQLALGTTVIVNPKKKRLLAPEIFMTAVAPQCLSYAQADSRCLHPTESGASWREWRSSVFEALCAGSYAQAVDHALNLHGHLVASFARQRGTDLSIPYLEPGSRKGYSLTPADVAMTSANAALRRAQDLYALRQVAAKLLGFQPYPQKVTAKVVEYLAA